MSDQLHDILKTKFGSVRNTTKFYYVRCVNCGKKKLYVPKIGKWDRTVGCWACGFSSTLDNIVSGLHISNFQDKPIEEWSHPQAQIYPATNYHPINTLPEEHPAVRFMREDKLENLDVLWNIFRVGFVPYGGGIDIKFENGSLKSDESLIFPVYQMGKQVGFQLRYVPGTYMARKMKKISYLTVANKSNLLYNYDMAKQSPFCVVFEGAKSTFKLPYCSVATLGKGIADKQIQLMLSWKTIILILDDDAQDVSKKLCGDLRISGRKAINIDLRDHNYKKPGDVPQQELQEIIKGYLPK